MNHHDTEKKNKEAKALPQTVSLKLFAGEDPGGQPVMEELQAEVVEKGLYRALVSPLFIRNLAKGDEFKLKNNSKGRFEVTKRSGRLALRVFRREHLNEVAQWLTPEVEKLDGECDLTTANALVYSLHVNVGFSAVETLFDNAASRFLGTVWYYGNVYDPRDGVTPLEWWDEFINQV